VLTIGSKKEFTGQTAAARPSGAAIRAPSASQMEPKQPCVCQIVHSLRVGGAELLAINLARRLRGSCRFLFVCLDEEGPLAKTLRQEGFPVHVVGRRPGADVRCSLRLARILSREKVDLIHAHQYAPFFYGITARLLSRRPSVLFTEHGRTFPDHPRLKRILANRLLLERRDRVTGVGQVIRQVLIDNEGIPPNRIQVIYNGIETARFTRSAEVRAAIRGQWGLAPTDFAVIQVARLDPVKDHAAAIRAAERVAARAESVHFFFVGDGPERAEVEAMVRYRNLERRVHVLGTRGDVPKLLQAADAALLTSRSEGIPLTLIEAMAAGLPVVSTRVGGVGEVIEDGLQGYLVEPGDDSALADRLLRLAHDSVLCEQMGRNGRMRANALFSESRMNEEYARLYEEMLACGQR
jgi:L-malate glycosyltransferase